MKKLFALFALLFVAFALVACGGNNNEPQPEQHKHTMTKVAAVEATIADEGVKEHYECSGCKKLFADEQGSQEVTAESLKVAKLPNALQVSSGALASEDFTYHAVGGFEGSWAASDANKMEATSIVAVTALDPVLGAKILANNPSALYFAVIKLGVAGAGWTSNAVADNKLYSFDGCYTTKVIRASYNEDEEAYITNQWISDPKTGHAESLTPSTLFIPSWQEAADEWGLAWNNNPVAISGAGIYYFIVADYNKVSDANTCGFGMALVKAADLQEGDSVAAKTEQEKPDPSAEPVYGVVGKIQGEAKWDDDIEMTKSEDGKSYSVVVEFAAGDEFKVRLNHDWAKSWGEGAGNFPIAEAGSYLVKLDFSESEEGVLTAVPSN